MPRATTLVCRKSLRMKIYEADVNLTLSLECSLDKLIRILPTITLQTDWLEINIYCYKPL